MRESADEYISKLLSVGENELYAAEISEDKLNLQGKYLKIIE